MGSLSANDSNPMKHILTSYGNSKKILGALKSRFA
jgi:hypothetical protein